jgi:hypothetical protein
VTGAEAKKSFIIAAHPFSLISGTAPVVVVAAAAATDQNQNRKEQEILKAKKGGGEEEGKFFRSFAGDGAENLRSN